jgi:hypothetical protein
MPFERGNDIYVVSLCDTGEVTQAAAPEQNTVSYDELAGSGDHHEADLRLLPFNGRVYMLDYYLIIRAERDGVRRKHETVCIRNGRGRIFTKKSRPPR